MEALLRPTQDSTWLERTKEWTSKRDMFSNTTKVEVMLNDREFFIKQAFFRALLSLWQQRHNKMGGLRGLKQNVTISTTSKRCNRIRAGAHPKRRQIRRLTWERVAEDCDGTFSMTAPDQGVLVQPTAGNKIDITVIDLCSSDEGDSNSPVSSGSSESWCGSESGESDGDDYVSDATTASVHEIEIDEYGYYSIVEV